MVLKSDIAFALLPHSTDRSALERLAQERHARGIYARLRGRQVPLPSSLHAQTFTHVANARPDSSTTHTRSGAQQTAGERVSAEEADYRYRYAWDRVQHPPGMGRSGYVPLSRYSVAGEYQNHSPPIIREVQHLLSRRRLQACPHSRRVPKRVKQALIMRGSR